MRAKKGQLVSQHIESLSRKFLEEYQDVVRDYVKGREGIYALYKNDKLYYVGLASNLRTRLRQHLNDRHKSSWNRFSIYLTVGTDYLREIEALILRVSKSLKGNKQKSKFGHSVDLMPEIRKVYRQKKKSEEDDLFGRRGKKTNRKKHEDQSSKDSLLSYKKDLKILKASYKGKAIRARVLRNGEISYGGSRFKTPSGAAKAACGKSKNGWFFWHYERAPGDWVKLDALRG